MVSTVSRPGIKEVEAGTRCGHDARTRTFASPAREHKQYLPYLLLKEVPSDDGCTATLVAFAIEVGNRPSVLMSRTVAEGDANAWLHFLSSLDERFPAAGSVRLVVIDGTRALKDATQRTWPKVRRQICWFHELRRLLQLLEAARGCLSACPEQDRRGRFSLKDEAACLAGAWAIPEASSEAAAVEAYCTWAGRWRTQFPAAIHLLQRDLPLLLAFLAEPAEVRGAIRSIDGFASLDATAEAGSDSANFFWETASFPRAPRLYS